MLRSAILALGPGSRSARARALAALGRDTSVRSRGAQSEPLAVIPIHDVKQRSVIRSRGARCCARVCASLSQVPSLLRPPASPRGFGASGRRDSSNSVPPMRGGWSADRRTLSFGRACDARPPCPGATGTSLSALHRGGFRMRTHEAGSRQWNRSRSDCPRHAKRPGGRGPDLPSLRFAPQRGTPLPAPPFRTVSGRRPSMSEDGNLCTINSLRSQ